VLAGVADPNETPLADFAALHPDVPRYASAEEMLASPPGEDDIVVVATPPWTHGDISIQALEGGRHVLCEKPFAIDVPTAEAMVETARRADRLVGCCSCRFIGLTTSERVAALLAAASLGPLYHVTFMHRFRRARTGVEHQAESSWFLNRKLSGGGVLSDWGPYDLALLNDVLRPAAVTVAHAWYANPVAAGPPEDAQFDVEQHVGATLVYRLTDGSEIVVSYERAACTQGGERSVAEIEGVDGAVSWDWLMMEDDSVTTTTDRLGEPAVSQTQYESTDGLGMHDRPLVYFVRRLRGQDAPIPVGDEALFNLRCLRAIYEAADTRTPVSTERQVT
jgi:predicted dehydrogenase